MGKLTQGRRAGFTLVEVLVTLVIIALLVAAVFPTLTRQIDDAEPTRLANDLSSIRTGIEVFQTNVRTSPADIEDLITVMTTSPTEDDLFGIDYLEKHVNRWKGPYVDVSSAPVLTGFGASVQNQFARCTSTASTACDSTASNFLAVTVTGLTSSEWGTANEIFDGENETNSTTAGKWRLNASGTGIYYAVPTSN